MVTQKNIQITEALNLNGKINGNWFWLIKSLLFPLIRQVTKLSNTNLFLGKWFFSGNFDYFYSLLPLPQTMGKIYFRSREVFIQFYGPFLFIYCNQHNLRVLWFLPVTNFFHITLVIHFWCDTVFGLVHFPPLNGIRLEFLYYSLRPSAGLIC